MSTTFAQFAQPFDFSWLQQVGVVNGAIGRLLVACLLGGVVGLEREVKRKAAGVRTNLLICMGSCLFHAALRSAGRRCQPEQGPRSLQHRAGHRLPRRRPHHPQPHRISGLTSAASVWVVASIGMACGAGLSAAATVATVIVLRRPRLVGFLERRANLKIYSLIYEARGRDQTAMLQSILDAMDKAGERLADSNATPSAELQRVSFTLTATKRQHERLRTQLLAEPAIDALLNFRDPEED